VPDTSSPSGTPGSRDAAAALRMLQSFAATVSAGPGPDDDDVLATRERAIPWLRAQGLMPADAMLTGSEHGALLRLRDALRDALAAHASGGGASPEIAARLTRSLADGRLVVTITDAGSVKLATAARSVYPSIVAAIAVAIAEADAAGAWLDFTQPGR
jgi:Putative stress-induced transcription regulator